jgi:integrase/recombinase XerD
MILHGCVVQQNRACVSDIKRNQCQTLFLARNGTSLNPSSIRKLVKKYYAKAGVRKSGVHTLRHTFSAHNVNNGMSIADLQKVLGHKKKETTLKYIHVVNTSLRETMLKTQA